MTIKTWGGVVAAAVMMMAGTAAPADAGCCQDRNQPCCEKAALACCDAKKQSPDAAAVLLPSLPVEPRPARETMTVWFTKPVKVGDRILFGKYVIEHDNNRMARGRPCTYIYAASDLRLPVVAFHCTHLTRAARARPSVMLQSLGDANGMTRLMEFQFAGEVGAHGTPGLR